MTSTISRAAEDRRTVFCVVAVLVVITFVSHIGAYDLWWHLKAGEIILESGEVPRSDPFSFTAADTPWTYHSWLSGVVLHLVHRVGGVEALIMLRALLIAASLMIAWVAARRRGVGPGLASVLTLAACYQLGPRALMRPYLFSFVLFAVFYIVIQGTFQRPALSTVRRFLWGGGGRLIVLPCLTVVWANLHAGFLVGLLIIGAFGAGEMIAVAVRKGEMSYLRALFTEDGGARFRALLVTGVLCLAAGVMTPYGPGVLMYPFRLLTEVKLVRQVQEWQATPFTASFAVFWLLLALTVVALVRSAWLCGRDAELREKVGQFCADVFLMAGFGLLAVRSVRNLAWGMLLVAPVVGYHFVAARHAALAGEPSGEGDRRRNRLYVLAAYTLGLVLALNSVIGGRDFGFGVSAERFPVRACDYLEGAPFKGRFYNDYAWGGYMIWRFWPQRKVFIDGRCLVYGDGVIGETMTVARGEDGWQGILERYGVEGLVIRYRLRDSAHFFRSGQWHCVYWDDVALVAVSGDVKMRDLPGVDYFDLSNPAMFEERLSDSPPGEILKEVARVLERDPVCWTAWAQRARCLLKLAEADDEGRAELLKKALGAARRAIEINDRWPETWRALAQCLEAGGRKSEAAKALRNAEARER